MQSRNAALDGLRGLAALMVLASHLVMASAPALALAVQTRTTPVHSVFGRVLLVTPLHVVWAGNEAVIVFFVLSGFVLALPQARGRTFAARSYYARRFLRLYIPVWGALAFAAALHLAVDRHPVHGASWWLNAHAVPLTAREAASNATLVVHSGGWQYSTALWSMKWEVIFSLLLPAFTIVARATSDRLRIPALLVTAAILFTSSNPAMRYMPCFFIGCLLADADDWLDELRARLENDRAARLLQIGLPVACILALTSRWWFGVGTIQQRAALVVTALGAALAVALAVTHGPAARFLTNPVVGWSGTRSFSLYLVHEPVVVTVAFALGITHATPAFAVVAIVLSLLAAEAFFQTVERPSHALSRAVGVRLRRGPHLAPRAT